MDAFTLSLFTNGWAKACKTGNIDDCPVPNFEAGVIFPPRHQIEAKLPSLSGSISQMVTQRVVFQAKKLSTSLVIAILWRAQIKAARARYGVPRSSLLSVAVNLRGRTRKRVPENCCGNFVTHAIARFEVEDHKKETGLNLFVEKVRDAIKKTISEVSEANDDESLYESVMRRTREKEREMSIGSAV